MESYQITLIGDGGTGKSSWVKQHIHGYFEKKYVATLGVEVHPMIFETNYGKYQLNIWDTAGQEKFGGLRDGYYINSNAAIIFCSATSKISIDNVIDWLVSYRRVREKAPVILLINKIDCDHKSSISKINELVNFLDIPTVMYSVKSRHNFGNEINKILELLTGKYGIKISNTIPNDNVTDDVNFVI